MNQCLAKLTVAGVLIAVSEVNAQMGSFQYNGAMYLPGNPVAMVSEDFNQDGNKDLAIVLLGSSKLSVMTGKADGSFQFSSSYSTGRNPGSIVKGDWNRDGKTDLAIVCQGIGAKAAPEITILLGTGDGSFLPGESFSVNGGPVAIATADFNGDGRDDLVVSYGSAVDPPYTVFLGEGSGLFHAVVPVTGGTTREAVPQVQSIVVGDFNRDGRLDLIISPRLESWLTAPMVARVPDILAIALGSGDGSFLPVRRITVDNGLEDRNTLADGSVKGLVGLVAMVAADFDGDGNLDLALLDDRDETFLKGALLLLSGNGEGGFHPIIGRKFVFNVPATMAVCDINGDKIPDLVVPQFSFSFTLCISGGCFDIWPPQESALWTFEGAGDGSFRETRYSQFNAYINDVTGKLVQCTDLNNDGKPDLVFLNNDTASIWLNR